MPESDASTDTSSTSATDTTADTATEEVDWKAEAEKWKTQARKHEERAKSNSTAVKELEDLRKQAMTDQERAVAEAKAAGRAELMVEMGAKLVAAEFRAAATGRIDDGALAVLMARLDLRQFINDDGDPDPKAIGEFIDGIAPKQADPDTSTSTFPDLGQGARGGDRAHMALNGDPLEKSLTTLLGIR